MKGLILCAGKGTRVQPFSFTIPKAMLPIVNKPVLHYCVAKLVELGIKDIGIVIHPSQESIIKKNMGSGERFGVALTYIYQNEPKGI
ncbi:sugar phosphate nucleotidyltransferase [Paenibacillus sp.]|jgi:glucose-1-phosphate thymidylyltransferase|uniref:sugar phosphate nucleotidyltransferase n=1 Tax=Paenibacillus sp. TaxID=58172 RepID=UPI00282A0CAB|nr:sugar phosphate nucleotidyltransferase [Paenibacillus sp.]MDR0269425.1 NTP transferase domain-containing protein [Paenibacillus sp.]